MSESEDPQDVQEKKPGLMGKLIVWGVIFVIGVGAGAAAPLLTSASDNEGEPQNPIGVTLMDIPEADDEVAFVEFGEIVANLDDPRFAKFITCNISLQVAKSQVPAITKLVEEKNVVLKNWLIGHARDKKAEDVRGKFGHNMLRREIHGKFNELLFKDGVERIQDVLFNDLKVQ